MKRTITAAVCAAALLVAASAAIAGTDVSVSISGYLPAPPGVHVYIDGGRPCYREGTRVVYLERDPHYHKRHRGHAYGHRDHDGGHGHGHGHGHGGRH